MLTNCISKAHNQAPNVPTPYPNTARSTPTGAKDGENAEAKQELDDDGNTQMTLTWSLEVVDVIHINTEGKITSIKAYKR